MAENTENTKNRLTGMLLSKSRRAQYIRLFAVLAACVVVAVAVVLHQNGVAMTHKEQVLTCPVEGVVAHTHDESCYDEDGNLVCTLPELELHTHTEECYDEEGALICGQEEVTEEHVHGPGCFTTITVEDAAPEGEAEDQAAESAMPAQEFDDEILDDQGNLWVHVSVKAPEGAFPANTTMHIAPLNSEDVRTKVEDALNKESEGKVVAKQMKAVDIKFFDAEGNEIEPAVDVEVKLTSDTVRAIADPVLVHIDKDETKDAEVLTKVDVVNQNEEDETEGNEDTLKFESNVFSPYVIVEAQTIAANVITASGETYNITVSYGEDAGIPANATLSATEITESEKSYEELASETASAVDTDAESIEHLRMFDISILDAQGNVVEPNEEAEVTVKIEYVGESQNIDEDQELKVVHFVEEGTEVIDPTTEGEEDGTLTFTTNSFSIYAVVSYGVNTDGGTALSELDGKSFAIVHKNTSSIGDANNNNYTRYLGRALTTTSKDNNTKLAASNVVVEQHETQLNAVTSSSTGDISDTANSTATITQWTFEKVPNQTNQYYIKAPNGQYLRINVYTTGWGRSKKTHYDLTVGEKQAFTVEESNGNVRITSNNRAVASDVANNVSDNGPDPTFSARDTSNNDAYCWLTLCGIEQINPTENPVYTGTKVSAATITDGAQYLIYKSVYTSDTYEDYVIDGDGNLVRAYDKGDSLTLRSAVNPFWTVEVCKNSEGQLTNYILLKNKDSQGRDVVLHPAPNTLTKVMTENSSKTDGVRLFGREDEEYNSVIELWDDPENTYYGFKVVTNDDGSMTLVPASSSESEEFSFAVKKASDNVQWHTVNTVDSAADGITIQMFDYNDVKNGKSAQDYIGGITGSTKWDVNVLQPQTLLKTLGEDGYPHFQNGNSGQALFDPGTTGNKNVTYKGTANHLFLESVYNSTGYYEYSCFNNFARYQDGNFTVYAEQGTPSKEGAFFYQRGNFLPYNMMSQNSPVQNLYNGDGLGLDFIDPTRNSNLYVVEGNPNYYFGMTMDFDFAMPVDGLIDGSPMVYEFNGDDDLWIFVDGVLLLDIGGRHDAFSGTINLMDGTITGRNANVDKNGNVITTIKGCFEAAGVFPDGTSWDPTKVDQYFRGNTFIDYGKHSFKMFYMEHGAGASNLEMRFNMPVIPKKSVSVKKELANTTQIPYSNVPFAYQIFVEGDNGQYHTLSEADGTYKKKTVSGTQEDLKFTDGVQFHDGGTAYDNVFYLKPGEEAIFTGIEENKHYYVRELGIYEDYYDKIEINNVKIDGVDTLAEDGVYQSTTDTAKNRATVVFKNTCSEKNSNKLLISKQLEDTPDYGDTFEFRVWLEGADGTLVKYKKGKYYIRKGEEYFKVVNGTLVTNGQTPFAMETGDGTIANIPVGYTVEIDDLLVGTEFKVEEIRTRPVGSSDSVSLADSSWQIVSIVADANTCNTEGLELEGTQGSIALDKDAQVVVTNKLETLNLQLQKVDGRDSNNLKPIDGSKFNLEIKVGNDWRPLKSDIAPTGTNATVAMNGLRIGYYHLIETQSPAGYTILDKDEYFEVYMEDDTLKARSVDVDAAGNIIDASVDNVSFDKATNTYTVVVKNMPGDELPATGGIGTTAFYITGAALAAAGLYGLSRRRNATHMA